MLRDFLKECLEQAYEDWLRDNKDEYRYPEEAWKNDFCEDIYIEYVEDVIRKKDQDMWYCTKGFMTYMLCKSIVRGEEF